MRGFLSFKERNRVKVEQMREEDLHYKKVVQPSLQSCVILKEGNARERERNAFNTHTKKKRTCLFCLQVMGRRGGGGSVACGTEYTLYRYIYILYVCILPFSSLSLSCLFVSFFFLSLFSHFVLCS